MKQPMEEDGNCCFNAIAFSLISNSDNLSNLEKDSLKTRGIDASLNLDDLYQLDSGNLWSMSGSKMNYSIKILHQGIMGI